MNQQLLFSSEDQLQQTFANFYPAENQNLLSAVKTFIESPGFSCLYFYGQSGSGKTHLLHSACNSVSDGLYLNVSTHGKYLQQICTEQGFGFLALDDFETINAAESSVLLMYETLKQASGKLLIGSKLPPKALPLKLNDLSSRLLGGQVFEIKLLNDADKIAALRFRAGLRGIELSDVVLNYIINRYPRDFKTLFALLDKFDDASLSNQRRITVPFIKELEN